MPRLEEAKKVHRELEDTREILKSLRNQSVEVLGQNSESVTVASWMDEIDSALRRVQGEIQKVVGREVMK